MKKFYVQTEGGVILGSFKTIDEARKFRDKFSSKLIILVKTKNEE